MILPENDRRIQLSIGILAWNEEAVIGSMLASLFRQSIFGRLAAQGQACEIICLANGCTDRTVSVVGDLFERESRDHPDRKGIISRVVDLAEPGRNNAWNRFVHEYSAPGAKYVCLMDADIILNQVDTLERVVGALEKDPHLQVVSDRPCKDIALKPRKTLRDRLSLATSDMTETITGRINGQLYCLRSEVARNLYLPRDVVANDDGFFKTVVCTDFLTGPADSSRVVSIREASHLYEPYLQVSEILNNQKRQMIGQTTVHVVIEYLKTLPLADRRHLAQTLRAHELRDPDWLKKLISAHVARTRFCWELFPGLMSFRWKRLLSLRGAQRISHLPAAFAGFVVTLISSWRAFRFLRGGIATYWPKASRQSILGAHTAQPAEPLTVTFP